MDPRLIDVEKLRKEMRAQDARRFQDPDVDPSLPDVWVLYGWSPKKKKWALAGFARTKHLRLPKLAKIRQKLRVPKHIVVKLMTLQHAHRVGPPIDPPSQFNPLVERSWLNVALRSRR